MNIRSFATVLWERRWVVLAIMVLAVLASPIIAKLIRPTYQATAEVAPVGDAKGGILPLGDLPELVLSVPVMSRVKAQMRLSDSVDSIRSATVIKMSPRSAVLPITYRSKNAAFALSMANVIADSTVYEYKDLAARQYDQVIDRLRSQLANQQLNVRNMDTRLQQAVQHDSFIGSASALEAISTRLDDLESQKATAHAALVGDQATMSAGGNASDQAGLDSVIREQTLANDPMYQALRSNQAKDVAAYDTTKAGYTDAFPGLAGLKEKVDREGADVGRAAQVSVRDHRGASQTFASVLLQRQASEARVAGDNARLQAIDSELGTTNKRLADLPRYGVAANQLRLQRDSAASAYQQLQNRLQTTLADQAQAASLGSLIVLDHATSAAPKIPRQAMVILIAVLILAAAIGSAYAAEALDPRIRTAGEAEALYGTPHIGSV